MVTGSRITDFQNASISKQGIGSHLVADVEIYRAETPGSY